MRWGPSARIPSGPRFAANSVVKKLTPVRFPPGRARLATRPAKRREGGTQMKKIVRLVALCAALIASGSAFAQQYPSKPVRVVVPFPPGGVTDIAGRLIAQKLSERLGHQFYIENISGAGGNIGMANAARSPGDGYTILLASSSIVVNPSLYNKVPYDVDKDFIPVTKAGATPNSWVVNSNFPVQTMKELID